MTCSCRPSACRRHAPSSKVSEKITRTFNRRAVDCVSMVLMKILLQTTIVPSRDDWSISRFELLTGFLREQGFDVTARDRATAEGPDPVLATLQHSDFDEMWLFAVDTGNGLSVEECE